MKKTLSLAVLDFRLIKPYLTSMLLLIGMGFVMGLFFESATTVSTYLTVMIVLYMTYPFTIGEQNELDMLYGTLSLNRGRVVAGRYLFAVGLLAAATVANLLVGLAVSLVLGVPFSLAEQLVTIGLLSGMLLVIAAMQYPLYFKYGYTKARTMAMLPMFALFALIFITPTLANMLGDGATMWSLETFIQFAEANAAGVEQMILIAAVAVPAFGLLVLAASYALSKRIYAKRDL